MIINILRIVLFGIIGFAAGYYIRREFDSDGYLIMLIIVVVTVIMLAIFYWR